MSIKSLGLAALLSLAPVSAIAEMIVENAYARSAGDSAQTGAAFMTIFNHGDQDDVVISATSDIAERVELHTHAEDANGVMQMIHVEDGFPIAAGETIALERGGKHVMFLGLKRPLAQGDIVSVTLTFQNAEPVTVEIPVDLTRQPEGGMAHGHGSHGHQ